MIFKNYRYISNLNYLIFLYIIYTLCHIFKVIIKNLIILLYLIKYYLIVSNQ